MPHMAITAENITDHDFAIRPDASTGVDSIQLATSSLEVPLYLRQEGLYLEFPINPDTHGVALTGMKLDVGSKISLTYPSYSVRGSPVHILIENLRATNGIPKRRIPAQLAQGRISHVYKENRYDQFFISRPSDNPWQIRVTGETMAKAYWNVPDHSLHIENDFFTLPMGILMHPDSNGTFFVRYGDQTRPLYIEDWSGKKTATGWPNPHAEVKFYTGSMVTLSPTRKTESWMVDGHPLCTFSFLTPPLGLAKQETPQS